MLLTTLLHQMLLTTCRYKQMSNLCSCDTWKWKVLKIIICHLSQKGKIVLQISFQIKMKSVHFKDVYNYKDSDVWHKEEFSAKSLLASTSFLGYNNKKCIKVIITNIWNNLIVINSKIYNLIIWLWYIYI